MVPCVTEAGLFCDQASKPMQLAIEQAHLFLVHLVEHPENLPELLFCFQLLSTEISQQLHRERILPGADSIVATGRRWACWHVRIARITSSLARRKARGLLKRLAQEIFSALHDRPLAENGAGRSLCRSGEMTGQGL